MQKASRMIPDIIFVKKRACFVLLLTDGNGFIVDIDVCLLSVFYLIEQLLADVDLLYFHRGQPQHRELHALLFSNNVWVL